MGKSFSNLLSAIVDYLLHTCRAGLVYPELRRAPPGVNLGTISLRICPQPGSSRETYLEGASHNEQAYVLQGTPPHAELSR